MYPPGRSILKDVPRYCTNLDAMHEAEKNMNSLQRYRYGQLLEGAGVPSSELWCATAAQRAECFQLLLDATRRIE